MAKIVIAGAADCPYYAKAELLGDSLKKNLPDFKLHKIVKSRNEWETWLEGTCAKRGWSHKKSPLIWRELIDRGGKGVIIGGANDFQEYAYSYYDIKSKFTSDDMTKIATENLQTNIELEEEEAAFLALSKPVKVCITNASSAVAYHMVADIARGDALGPSDEISLTLLDSEENLEALEGIEMEALDLACPLLRDVTVTSNIHQAFCDTSIIFMLDELIQEEDESREDWMKRNYKHFVNYARIIDSLAKKDAKVLVSGQGPVNFNAQMMIEAVEDIPRENIVAVPRLVENHAKSILAERLKVNSAGVMDVIIWGNVNSTLYVDVSRARVHNYDGAIWGPPSFSLPVTDTVHDEKWVQSEFLEQLSNRLEKVETALSHKAAKSEAASLVTLLHNWWCGTSSDTVFSLGVYSEGFYDIPEGQVFSVPVTFTQKGNWKVVPDVPISDENKQKLQDIVKELNREREVIYPPPKPPTPLEQAESDEQNANNSALTDSEQSQTDDAKVSDSNKEAEGEEEQGEEEGGEKPSSSLRRIVEDKEGEEQAQEETGDAEKEAAEAEAD